MQLQLTLTCDLGIDSHGTFARDAILTDSKTEEKQLSEIINWVNQPN